jgi:hypothetical protein
MGVTAVQGRASYTQYHAEDIPGIRDLLFSRNIMIESSYIPIEIHVSKYDGFSQLSVEVWEDSTGLSFNSVYRTHIEWGQVLVPRFGENGELIEREMFFKLRVVEPSGIVRRGTGDEWAMVIHLPSTDGSSANQQGYNFILNTGRSNVKFTGDDDYYVRTNPLNVGNLEITNASGEITLPAPGTVANPAFHVEVNNVVVDSRSVTLDHKSPVSGNVLIMSDLGNFTFGDIGGDLWVEGREVAARGVNRVTIVGETGVEGDVVLRGTNIVFNQSHRLGGVALEGELDFDAQLGSVTVSNSGHIKMRTTSASLTGSPGGIIQSIDLVSEGDSTVNVHQLGKRESLGTDDDAFIRNVRGTISIRRVWVHVDVESRYSAITVAFDTGIPVASPHVPSLTIKTYDGAIVASNIVGEIDIRVTADGRGTVDAHFRQIKAGDIWYDGSTRRGRDSGNVDVRLARNIPYCLINVVYTRAAHNKTSGPSMLSRLGTPGTLLQLNASLQNMGTGTHHDGRGQYHVNHAERGVINNTLFGNTNSTGNLRIHTSNTLNVHHAASIPHDTV